MIAIRRYSHYSHVVGLIFFFLAYLPSLALAKVVPKNSALTQAYERISISHEKRETSKQESRNPELASDSSSDQLSDGKPSATRPFQFQVDSTTSTESDLSGGWKASPIDETPAPTTSVAPERPSYITQYFYSINQWKRVPQFLDFRDLWEFDPYQPEGEIKEEGFDLPLNSNLQITGHKSVTVELNKTHYFGQTDRYSFYGMNSGYSSSYNSGLDLGLSSSYSDSYSSYGRSGSYGGGYDSYGGGSYGSGFSMSRGGAPRASGINIRQSLQVGLHGRVGEHTHVEVDYSDSGGDSFGGSSYGSYGGYSGGVGGAKQQKIRVWYEGKPEGILKRVAFGDIMLNLPNTRFLDINRNLFGLEAIAEYKGARLTAFGSRSKGITDRRRFRGESRRAGYGRGQQIADHNYVKERFYFIQLGEDSLLHDSYLPIKQGSVEIYIDDGVANNNQGGQRTVQGYFNLQYPGQDYNIDYETGQVEFLVSVSPAYKIVVAYEHLGDGGGIVGSPKNVFNDENGDGSIDEKSEVLGYVTLKDKAVRGTESRRVYSLGNRNINPRDFQLTIWRQGAGESFNTPQGDIPYIQIFGLDQDGDGRIEPEYIDFDRGILTFPAFRPFMIEDPDGPYYPYREQLNNEAIYAENSRYGDQIYTIQADYAYHSDSYNVGLFVIPNSETVRLNGRKLQRDVDYMMIYEVGTLRFMSIQLDEYDEIEVEFERAPFGGALQQTVAGMWLEYDYTPKEKKEKEGVKRKFNRFDRLMGTAERSRDRVSSDRSFSSPGAFGRGRMGQSGGFGRSSFGGRSSGFGGGYGSSSFGGGFGSSSFGMGGRSRRGMYGTGGRTHFNPVFKQGLNLSTGYIINTGQKPIEVPDPNEVPSRLQAFNLNTSFGQKFNLAWLVNPVPFIYVEDFPLTFNFSGEAAFSHNNPNSVGLSMVDGMEGARETTNVSSFKHNWRMASVPYHSNDDEVEPNLAVPTVENRAVFRKLISDEKDDKAVGNYMRNKRLPASVINPMARSTEELLVMEIGYDLSDVIEEWGGFSYGLSAAGADFSRRESLEMWIRPRGDDNVTLYIDIGVVSEDADLDFRLDSEDLPKRLDDANGDGKIDALDLDLENLPIEHKYRANGTLDTGEDTGWDYDPEDGLRSSLRLGADNKALDTEDLNGDGVLDDLNAYLEISLPLDKIPEKWIKRKRNNGWMFISIPLTEAVPHGDRIPNLGYVQHFRFWLQKNRRGSVYGQFQWSSIELVGNQWEQGIVTQNGTPLTNTDEKFVVATKDNYNFDDYQVAYDQLKDNKIFRKLHPYTNVNFAFDSSHQKEQSLVLSYNLLPKSFGITSKRLRGRQQGEGQDFSKHNKLKFWLYGDKSQSTFVMRLASTGLRSSYRSSYYYSSNDPFSDPLKDTEDKVNVFENLTDYYEFTMPTDFEGWKFIEIDLRDERKNERSDPTPQTNLPFANNSQLPPPVSETLTGDIDSSTKGNTDDLQQPDGHPDGLTIKGSNSVNLSIKNIGGILLGLRNDKTDELSGEIWVNDIHLSDPLVKSGWARRGNLSVELGQLLKIQSGFASQDKNFESSAGQTSRQNMYDRGYSTTNNDYNLNTDLTLFSWLPIRYAISHQETETESRRGSISSSQSGKSKTLNRDISSQFSLPKWPMLGVAYNKQDFWNERQGSQLSDLYTGTFRYNLGQRIGLDLQYRHEDVDSDTSTATSTTAGRSSYGGYYGYNQDEKVDTGSISLNLQPFESFGINTRYDVRRELEKKGDRKPSSYSPYSSLSNRSVVSQTEQKPESEIKDEEEYVLAAREHRLSINPRINKDLLGMRPTITNQVSFNENWFGESKDASINANIRLGLGVRPKSWFGWLFNRQPKTKKGDITLNDESTQNPAIGDMTEDESNFNAQIEKENELNRLEEMGIDRDSIESAESLKGDWIQRDKQEIDQKLLERQNQDKEKPKGLLQRSVESLSLNSDVSFNTQDYLRQLESGDSLAEIIQFEEGDKRRSRARTGTRYNFRTAVDPWSWTSLSGNYSHSNSFMKSSSTSSKSNTVSYDGNLKLFNAKNTSTLQLRYRYMTRDHSNINARIGGSLSYEPSVSWRHSWKSGTRTTLGVRTTFRDQERAGINSFSLIVTPSFNVDYKLSLESGIRIPFRRKAIKLEHDLDLSNTFSTVVRREKFGANREERSERYETTLQMRYNLSAKLNANLNLGVSYNQDHVEEGRDYLSLASSLTVRGEFR